MKRTIYTILALLCAMPAVFAQGTAFQELRLDRSPVYTAMAGAGLASSSSTAFAAFGNPAAAPFSNSKFDVTVAYGMLSPSSQMSQNAFSAGLNAKLGRVVALSFAGNYNAGKELENIISDINGNRTTNKFRASSMQFALGLGVNVFKGLSLGVNLKYAMQNLTTKDTSGKKVPECSSTYPVFAADAYLLYKWRFLGVTAGVASLGSTVRDADGNRFKIPSSARLGVNFAETFGQKHFVDASVDADYYFSGAAAAALGAQYGFNDMVFVRAGYRYGGKSVVPSFASAGLGVKFFGVHIDASYVFGNDSMANTFCVGLGYCF